MQTLVLFTTLLASQDPLKDDPLKAEKELLFGTWAVQKAEIDGERPADEELKRLKVVIQQDRLTLKQGEKAQDATYLLNPRAKPKTIDLTAQAGLYKGQPMAGIYEIKGDTLTLCVPLTPDKARPKSLEAKAGSGLMLLMLKREKP